MLLSFLFSFASLTGATGECIYATDSTLKSYDISAQVESFDRVDSIIIDTARISLESVTFVLANTSLLKMDVTVYESTLGPAKDVPDFTFNAENSSLTLTATDSTDTFEFSPGYASRTSLFGVASCLALSSAVLPVKNRLLGNSACLLSTLLADETCPTIKVAFLIKIPQTGSLSKLFMNASIDVGNDVVNCDGDGLKEYVEICAPDVTTVAPSDDVTTVASSEDVTTVASSDDVTTVASTNDVTTVASTNDVTTVASANDVTTVASTNDVTTVASTNAPTQMPTTAPTQMPTTAPTQMPTISPTTKAPTTIYYGYYGYNEVDARRKLTPQEKAREKKIRYLMDNVDKIEQEHKTAPVQKLQHMDSFTKAMPCMAVFTTSDEDSPRMLSFFNQMKKAGVDPSTIRVLKQVRDPEHSSRGVWNGHISAWKQGLEDGCDGMLVFEDDAFFAMDETTDSGLLQATSFLKSKPDFDLFLLGYVGRDGISDSVPVEQAKCVYQIPFFDSLHAYVISANAMRKWHDWKWFLPEDKTVFNLDEYLGGLTLSGTVKVSAVYPAIAFQAYHEIVNAWGIKPERQDAIAHIKSHPGAARFQNDFMFDKAKNTNGCGRNNEKPAPTVFLLGVQKCGTTKFSKWLALHQDLVRADQKELHFFDSEKLGQLSTYNEHFGEELPHSFSHYFEATPNYFYDSNGAIEKMVNAYGEAFKLLKFLVIVKDPVERLESWWNHFRYTKDDPDFATNTGSNTLSGFVDIALESPGRAQTQLLYGAYAMHLKKWIDAGAMADQFEVVFLNEFTNQNEVLQKRVFDFLAVPFNPDKAEKFREESAILNNERVHLETLSDEQRKSLNHFYTPWNCELASTLDSLGIRNYKSSVDGSSGWIPRKNDCALYTKIANLEAAAATAQTKIATLEAAAATAQTKIATLEAAGSVSASSEL